MEIPKDNGKTRKLGIPTAADRVIQQAMAQGLPPIYEPRFCEPSYGFRPGRGAHDALRRCREYLNAGKLWTVDIDLARFFDTVNQSKRMEILSRAIKDGRVLSLIHRYLRAGVAECGRSVLVYVKRLSYGNSPLPKKAGFLSFWSYFKSVSA